MGGGTTEQTAMLPEFAETGVQQTLGMGRDAAAQAATYIPTYGPTQAAQSPYSQLATQQTDMMNSAFNMGGNMPSGGNYLPETQTYAGGIQGYSSAPLENQIVNEIREENPGYAQYTESFGINPQTGEVGSRAPQSQPVALEMQGSGGGK
tara:strand:+ start:4047 stop:4496 length:450 start_codon:yes stop_codon:yes gene_type:complete